MTSTMKELLKMNKEDALELVRKELVEAGYSEETIAEKVEFISLRLSKEE